MTRRPQSTRRSAFTLIELLIVITIIALLVAITLPAVFKVKQSAKRAQAGADIAQLNTAAVDFNQEFKFYPPDSFTIPMTKNASDLNNQVFARMYPRFANQLDSSNSNIPSTYTNRGLTMQGIQCLFYFLTGPSNTGWALDGPYEPSATALNKKGPFFIYSGTPLPNYVYQDPWGNPYAYFGSGTGGKYTSAPFTFTNAEGLPMTVRPYLAIGAAKFVNEGTCQIICAGPNGGKIDGGFGPGGPNGTGISNWTPGAGAYDETFKPSGGVGSGYDDIANFHGGKPLGAE